MAFGSHLVLPRLVQQLHLACTWSKSVRKCLLSKNNAAGVNRRNSEASATDLVCELGVPRTIRVRISHGMCAELT